jgi:hypothetical protein
MKMSVTLSLERMIIANEIDRSLCLLEKKWSDWKCKIKHRRSIMLTQLFSSLQREAKGQMEIYSFDSLSLPSQIKRSMQTQPYMSREEIHNAEEV